MLCELLLRCRIPKLLSCTALLRHHVPRFQQHHLLDCWDQLLSLVQQRRKGSRLQQRKLRNWTMMVECFRQRLNIIRHPHPLKNQQPKKQNQRKKKKDSRESDILKVTCTFQFCSRHLRWQQFDHCQQLQSPLPLSACNALSHYLQSEQRALACQHF